MEFGRLGAEFALADEEQYVFVGSRCRRGEELSTQPRPSAVGGATDVFEDNSNSNNDMQEQEQASARNLRWRTSDDEQATRPQLKCRRTSFTEKPITANHRGPMFAPRESSMSIAIRLSLLSFSYPFATPATVAATLDSHLFRERLRDPMGHVSTPVAQRLSTTTTNLPPQRAGPHGYVYARTKQASSRIDCTELQSAIFTEPRELEANSFLQRRIRGCVHHASYPSSAQQSASAQAAQDSETRSACRRGCFC